jgi:hypothetical protein
MSPSAAAVDEDPDKPSDRPTVAPACAGGNVPGMRINPAAPAAPASFTNVLRSMVAIAKLLSFKHELFVN